MMHAFLTSVIQTVAIACIAPIVPGTIQTLKAFLQGRKGPSILQPYRELTKLWRKSTFLPTNASYIYQWAPALIAACQVGAIMVLAPFGMRNQGMLGHDMFVLIGFLILGRFLAALTAWDTASGFALMGAARDLMLAIWAEVVLLLAFLLEAIPASTTDLRGLSAASSGWGVWLIPAHLCAFVAFALIIIAETGRQPIDNPDTHLELTMIHEGPLLEYSGPDLAYLQWSAAARHALVIFLAFDIFLPHGGSNEWRIVEGIGWTFLLVVGLALTETLFSKMRLLRVPVVMATGSLIAFVGTITLLVGGAK